MRFKRKEQTMFKSKLALCVLCASLVLLSGCSDRENSKSSLSKVSVYNNEVQTALPGEHFPNDLIIVLFIVIMVYISPEIHSNWK